MSTNGCKGIRPKLYSKVEFRTQPLVDIYNFTPVLSIVNQSITDNSVEVRSNRKSKANDKKQNQNEETKSKYLHCQPIDHVQLSRGEITPTSDLLHDPQSPTSHFLKNFLKMENNLKNNVQTIPIISYYHLCLLQNGTTFPQDVTEPLSKLCRPSQ